MIQRLQRGLVNLPLKLVLRIVPSAGQSQSFLQFVLLDGCEVCAVVGQRQLRGTPEQSFFLFVNIEERLFAGVVNLVGFLLLQSGLDAGFGLADLLFA